MFDFSRFVLPRRRFCLGIGALSWGLTAEESTPVLQRLVAGLDSFRRPDRPFEVHLSIRATRDGKFERESEFHVLTAKNAQRSRFDTITRCLRPEDDRGKVLLSQGAELWLYDPKAARPVRIDPRRLRDKFWEIDVLVSNFTQDYTAQYLGEETISDVKRKEHLCHHLKLTLREKLAFSPPVIEYWIDKQTGIVFQGRFYNAGGRLMRSVFYTDFTTILGAVRPMRGFVVHSLDRGLMEEIRFKKLTYRDTPAQFFTPEGLPAISKGELK